MNKIIYFFIACSLLTVCSVKKNKPSISIDVWYGTRQEFGQLGLPQKWINILGNVQSEYGIETVNYTLNKSEPRELTLGSDLHRLAAEGDFNIDLSVADCLEGENEIIIIAKDTLGNQSSNSITAIVHKNNQWPLPYQISWSQVNDIQDVVQVVDGHWVITENGLQNVDTYYDRVVAFGDDSWENYEVTTTVTFHDFTPPKKGPPTYNVSHAAIATRWPGHDIDSLQPHRKWYPLGATAEFRLTAGLDSCRWRIFDGPKPYSIKFYVEQTAEEYRSIETNKVYGMKHRVETIGQDSTRYSVKLWPFEQQEPEVWDFSGVEAEENFTHGSALLLAHNTNVTFGDVSVIPIEK